MVAYVFNAVAGWFVDKALAPIISGIILAALGSWLIARWNERFKGRREHLTKAVDGLRTQADALVKACSDYWCEEDATKARAKEAEINFKLSDLNTLAMICASEIWKSQSDIGPKLMGKLLSSVVTPTFGTPERKVDPNAAMSISQAAAALVDEFSNGRSQFFQEEVGLSASFKEFLGQGPGWAFAFIVIGLLMGVIIGLAIASFLMRLPAFMSPA